VDPNKPSPRSDLTGETDYRLGQFKELENYVLTNPFVMVEIPEFIDIHFES
jgi:hypothetical protein